MSWGMRGTYFAVFIRVMPGLVWDGIEAFWGGQAVSTCIGAMSLSWADWDYPLADGTLQLKDLIGCEFCLIFKFGKGAEADQTACSYHLLHCM